MGPVSKGPEIGAMSLHDSTLTPEFCAQWTELLQQLYGYRFDGPFAIVRSLNGRATLSHLPLLTYTSLKRAAAESLASAAGSRQYQIRVLNPDYKSFRKHDPVTMRIDLSRENIGAVQAAVSKRTLRYLREAEQAGFEVRSGVESRLVEDFHGVFCEVMHRLGSPPFSIRLFRLLGEIFRARFHVVYSGTSVAAAAVVLHDREIAWVPWSGTATAFLDRRPGLLMYWRSIQEAYSAGKILFDFGRSGYESGTYEFKLRWGAIPVKVDTLAPHEVELYSKYQLASRLWRHLPRAAADSIGPVLCRYLPDL